MALINCPGCGKRVSAVLSMCPECGDVRDKNDSQQDAEIKRRMMRDRVYHLKMISYLAITVFVAGFGWYWWDTGGFQQSSSAGPLVLQGLAAVAYIVIRGLLFAARRRLKIISRAV
ncbi:MAG: hypothetical protein HKN15_13205 [Xanthomonadales bacterium]|nr:hypothetical protein [Xanthomonadales bacterium]